MLYCLYMIKRIFVALLIIVVIVVVYLHGKPYLPKVFDIHLTHHKLSSGGESTITAVLTYSSSRLILGTEKYESDNGGVHIEYTCNYQSGKWINTTTKEECNDLSPDLLTTKGLKEKIRNKEIIPVGESCGHNQTCYIIDTHKGSFDS